MSEKGSVFQKGGGGTNFEQFVQTSFLVTLIIRGNVPCLPPSQLCEIALQVSNRGYETDDFLAVARSTIGEHRLLIQAKHDIPISADNLTFRKVMSGFWKDYCNTTIFNKENDRLLIVKNGLTKEERNHVKALFQWARTHATEIDFVSEVNRIKGKKDRLEMFRELLKEVNGNCALTDREIWEFLKCVEVLEYDFMNGGSIDKTYFLNLIKLSKNKNSIVSESEIWDSVFAYIARLNPTGGSATLESIINESFYKHFDNAWLSPYSTAIEKLKSDSKDVLRPIKSTIGMSGNEYRLPRTEVRALIAEAMNDSQLTIVTGRPGVGKSSAIKEVLEKDYSGASIFVFRADQFNEPTIAKVFSCQGIHESIHDIFSCIALIPEKVIFLDSLEKLLEADPECSFRQLLALVRDDANIKIIASSRGYAVDLLTVKFDIDMSQVTIVEVPALDEGDLKRIVQQFPQLGRVLKNRKIYEFLQSPKYIDFAIKTIGKSKEDYADVSLSVFKERLWNSLVADRSNTRDGLHLRRVEMFMEIAVNRAREMKLFARPERMDESAIQSLLNDEILFKDSNSDRFSPAHDVLEDWALTEFVRSKYEEFGDQIELFDSLGNGPAIRRAFRLWVEEELSTEGEKVYGLIRLLLFNSAIEDFWADELLVAVFRSEDCRSFFDVFDKELMAQDARFLNRCLHIIRTCCKAYEVKGDMNDILIPIGSGWGNALLYIQDRITQTDGIWLSINNLLSDWHDRLLFKESEIEKEERGAAKRIVLYYLWKSEEQRPFALKEITKTEWGNLIGILFDLADSCREEIRLLVERAIDRIKDRSKTGLHSFYRVVIDKCLSGVDNERLIFELPELIVELALDQWKETARIESENGRSDLFVRGPMLHEDCWGIKNGGNFFPSGFDRTPAYNLLRYRPMIGLKFVVQFLNHCVATYVNSTFDYKHSLSEVELILNDETAKKYWGDLELWGAYRRITTTHPLMESLLLSLERILLEMVEQKTDGSRASVEFYFNYIMKESNNVAPLAVLVSIAMAYPEEVKEAMLPLLSNREFYEWDRQRALYDPAERRSKDQILSIAHSGQLKSGYPHRRQYRLGLAEFVFDYQFRIRELNPQIHEIMDRFRSDINDQDIIWKKQLNEIDVRNWEFCQDDKELDGFRIQPKYDEDVVDYIDSKRDLLKTRETAALISDTVSRCYNNNEAITYEQWVGGFEFYNSNEDIEVLYSMPVTLAFVGLDRFSTVLSADQREWCLYTLAEAIVSIGQHNAVRMRAGQAQCNVLERSVAWSSFHLLVENMENTADLSAIVAAIIYILCAPFSGKESGEIADYIREIFFSRCPNEAKRVWVGLIKYSRYVKENAKSLPYQNNDEYERARRHERRFIEKIASEGNPSIDFSQVDFEKNDGDVLVKALVILPYDAKKSDYKDFVFHMLPLVIEDFGRKRNYGEWNNEGLRQCHEDSSLAMERYIGNLFLHAPAKYSEVIMTTLVESVLSTESIRGLGEDGLIEFVNSTLEYCVLRLFDMRQPNCSLDEYNQHQERFWKLWEVLFRLLPDTLDHPLVPILMLDIEFLLYGADGQPIREDWIVLEGKREFYKKVFLSKGKAHASSVIRVFSTIGGKAFLPEGISWLVEVLKGSTVSVPALAEPSGVRMIKYLFYNCISKMKNDRRLIDDYVWILNRMVDMGSSEAYMIRENVIIYKKTVVERPKMEPV